MEDKKCHNYKPPYVKVRLFTANEIEAMKQVAYVNFTLNDFEEVPKILGDFMFVENCSVP